LLLIGGSVKRSARGEKRGASAVVRVILVAVLLVALQPWSRAMLIGIAPFVRAIRCDEDLEFRRHRHPQALTLLDQPSGEILRQAHAIVVWISLGEGLESPPSLLGGIRQDTLSLDISMVS
jgi:hypothetical protein